MRVILDTNVILAAFAGRGLATPFLNSVWKNMRSLSANTSYLRFKEIYRKK